MADVFLDPYLLALPDSTQPQYGLKDYVSVLLGWEALLGQQGLRFLKSKEADATLYQGEAAPTWENVSAAIKTCGADYIQERDVTKVVEQFLRISVAVETVSDIEEFATDGVQVQPLSLMCGRPDHFVAHCHDLLMLAGIHQIMDPPDLPQFLATRFLSHEAVDATFEGYVLLREAGQTDQERTIRGSLRLSGTAYDLERQLDPIVFWQNGYIEGALSLYLGTQQAGFYGPIQNRKQGFRFAPAFWELLKPSGFSHDPPKIERLLRALRETVTGIRMEDVHSLRTGVGGNSPQRKRNRDLAWRRDIDSEYHLHYWATSNGPEFVQVGVHNNFEI